MRQSITIGLGILIAVAGFYLTGKLIDSKKSPKQVTAKIVKTVFTEEVLNTNISIQIQAGGNIQAKERIEIYSEVQGVMIKGTRDFRTGNSFQKGDIFLRVDPSEFKASLLSQKSNFFTLLTGIMADLQLDYPEEYPVWKQYLQNIDLQKDLPELPKTQKDKLKYFLSARNIITSFHQVKNLEVRLSKYVLRAPFSGILTDSNLNPGTLIRGGQKLGEFIRPGRYEIELSVPASFSSYLKVGEQVQLVDKTSNKMFTGSLERINAKVEQSSQMLKVFVLLENQTLKEGIYLEASIQGKTETEVYEVPRSLLIDNKSLFIVQNNLLKLIEIDPVYFNESSVIIRGLENGQNILSRALPGAYNGMEVKLASVSSSN